MVNIGLLACGGGFGSPFCIVKLIECAASLAMLTAVLYIMVQRAIKERRINFFLMVSLCMMLTLVFIIISSLDSDLQLFNFLYSYFYNVYFSIIVLKLGLKLLEKVKQSEYYKCYQGISYGVFTVYQMLILAALIYSSLTSNKACLDLPFLIANAISLAAAVLFALLGIKHSQWQQQKLDENLPLEYQNNPLPRFRIWILLNCIGQLMVLIQSVIYQVNNCKFSDNPTINEICDLFFVFICYHMGILATIFFFHHTAPQLMTRKYSNASTINQDKVQIQMAYYGRDEIRSKMVSQ